MGIICDWLFDRQVPQGATVSPCKFCRDPLAVKGSLEDLGVPGPQNCYLLRCPKCGRYWGGYAYSPQVLYELSLAEVRRDFPTAI